MIASEVERLRAPDRASEAAQAAFLTALFQRRVTDRGDILARASELGTDLAEGGAVVVVRAHHFAPADDDWRARVLAAAERAARSGAPGSLAAVVEGPTDPQGHVVVLLPTAEDAGLRRVAEGIARELHASVHGFTFAVGHSRVAHDPVDLYRAGNEALLAANVATASQRRRRDARVRGHRRLPPAAARDERGPGRTAALLRRRRSRRWWPTTTSTRPTWCRRSRRSSTPTATSPAPPPGSTRTAIPSATGSSA